MIKHAQVMIRHILVLTEGRFKGTGIVVLYICMQWFVKINVFLRLWASHIPATVPIREHIHASQKEHKGQTMVV